MIDPKQAAFAAPDTEESPGSIGINVRTYIATAALQGLLAKDEIRNIQDLVDDSVRYADTLIKALNRAQS